jgi:hypothetical protein
VDGEGLYLKTSVCMEYATTKKAVLEVADSQYGFGMASALRAPFRFEIWLAVGWATGTGKGIPSYVVFSKVHFLKPQISQRLFVLPQGRDQSKH